LAYRSKTGLLRFPIAIPANFTGKRATMWGNSMVGFGRYHYKYASGREGEFFLSGFSPRKQALTIYIMSGFQEHAKLLDKLGKFKTGKSCLYLNRLYDIDREVLARLTRTSVDYMQATYPVD
jgi:hypothetical protein